MSSLNILFVLVLVLVGIGHAYDFEKLVGRGLSKKAFVKIYQNVQAQTQTQELLELDQEQIRQDAEALYHSLLANDPRRQKREDQIARKMTEFTASYHASILERLQDKEIPKAIRRHLQKMSRRFSGEETDAPTPSEDDEDGDDDGEDWGVIMSRYRKKYASRYNPPNVLSK